MTASKTIEAKRSPAPRMRARHRGTADPGPPEGHADRLARIRSKAPVMLEEALAAIRNSKAETAANTIHRIAELLEDDRGERPVPSIRTRTIEDHAGRTLREPTVERADWRDPTDTSPNRREARRIEGYRAADALKSLQRRGGQITDLHIQAARLLRTNYELGVLGARPGYERPVVSDRYFGPSDGPLPSRIKALSDYRDAHNAVPRSQWAILEHVVLNNRSVSAYARDRRSRKEQATGYLLAALDCLVDHYDLKKKQKRKEDRQ